jgi:hypothetical protein
MLEAAGVRREQAQYRPPTTAGPLGWSAALRLLTASHRPTLAPAAERWPQSAAACRAGATHHAETMRNWRGAAWSAAAAGAAGTSCEGRSTTASPIDCCGCCLAASDVLPLLWGWQLQRRARAAAGACQLCALRFFAWQLSLAAGLLLCLSPGHATQLRRRRGGCTACHRADCGLLAHALPLLLLLRWQRLRWPPCCCCCC